jgi:hypothetical protein
LVDVAVYASINHMLRWEEVEGVSFRISSGCRCTSRPSQTSMNPPSVSCEAEVVYVTIMATIDYVVTVVQSKSITCGISSSQWSTRSSRSQTSMSPAFLCHPIEFIDMTIMSTILNVL